MRKITIPKEAEEWFVNVALLKGPKRSWKKTARHPAILATALAVLVMAGLGIFYFVEQLQEFPGSATAKKLLVVASQTRPSQLDRLDTDAINLGDYFFMKFQLEHFEVPMRFADFRATGARVFEDEDGHRVGQVVLAESGVQFFFFPCEKSASASPGKTKKPRWNFVSDGDWTGAVEQQNGIYFMVAKRGSKAELRPYLSERLK